MIDMIPKSLGRLMAFEAGKTLRDRKLVWVMVALSLFALLLQIGFRLQRRNPLLMISRKGGFDPDLMLNAINTTRLILNSSYYLFFPLIAALIFAAAVAAEKNQGTLWMVMVRPVSRRSVLLAKWLTGCGALALVVMFFVGFNLAVGVALFGTGDFLSSPRVFDLLGGSESAVLSFSTGVGRLVVTGVLLVLLLLPTAAMAFYAGIICRTPQTAMLFTMLIFFGSYILQQLGNIGWLPFFADIKPYLFTSCMEAWVYVFSPQIDWIAIAPRLVIMGIYAIALFAATAIHWSLVDLD